MAKKETRYGGKYQYFRKRLTGPDGQQYTVYGKTKTERDEKVAALQSQWAIEAEEGPTLFVAEYCAEWFRRVSGSMSAGRQAAIRREINRNICPIIGTKQLKDLTSDDIMDVMAARDGLSQSARRLTLQTLNRVLNAAEAAGKIPRNPGRDIKAGGRKTQKKIALTPEQQRTLLDAVQGQRIWLFCMIALYAGLRREEICALRWSCVTLTGDAPHIDVRRACRWPTRTKPEVSEILKSDAAWRTIPIPDPLLAALKDARDKAAAKTGETALQAHYVVGNADGTPWTMKQLQVAWGVVKARSTGTVKRIRKDPITGERTKVEVEKKLGDRIPRHAAYVTIDFPVSPHILRHTYITRLVLGRVDLRRCQYLAGHSDPSITIEIYTSLFGHQPEDLIGDVRAVFPE